MTGAGACWTSARNAAVRAAGTGMPYWVSRCESVAGCSGRPAFWPGNSQRPAGEMTAAGWSAAAAAAWRSSAAKGSGTQTGGSPSRRNVVPVPSAVMSSAVSRVMRDARLGEQQDQQARGPGPDRAGAVGKRAADQREALLLADGLSGRAGSRVGGQLQAGQESLGHGEAEEAGGHLGGGAAGGGVPAVQAGLGAGRPGGSRLPGASRRTPGRR